MGTSNSEVNASYVLEMPGQVVRLLAQLVHIHLAGYPRSQAGQEALNILYEQTPLVQKAPEYHNVFPGYKSKSQSVPSPSIYHIPVR